MKQQYIKVGKIVNNFGINGELKIYLYTDFPKERFEKGTLLYLGKETNPDELQVQIESSKPYKNLYLIKLNGYNNINEILKFKNYYLWITKEQQEALPEGEYYYHQILGCEAITTNGEELGVIKEILAPGANDVWVIKPNNGEREILIPYIDSVVKQVDIAQKKVIIELIDGLLDL